MAGSSNIVGLLLKRQASAWKWSNQYKLMRAVDRKYISLTQIMDRDRNLLHGHVVLGFSGCGHYLISYLCEITSAPPTHEYHYSLHCWLFDMHKPLVHVIGFDLFRGELLHRELHIIVSEAGDGTHLVVLGCKRSCANDDRRPCCVTILPRPKLNSLQSELAKYSIHFKFDLLPPFPSFVPSLSLRIPGCVVLNTGDSIVAVYYTDVSSEEAFDQWLLQQVTSNKTDNLTQHKTSCSFYTKQYFTSPGAVSVHEFDGEECLSPSHLLPVEVYSRDVPLIGVHSFNKKNVTHATLVIEQSSLDVELWVNGMLQTELTKRGYSFHSLSDYDLQLVEVSDGAVVFVIVVMVQASSRHTISLTDYSIQIMGVWNVHTAHAQTLSVSHLDTVCPVMSQSCWNPAAALALKLRRDYYSHCVPEYTIRAFSNHTVYTGKSLQALSHPVIPVSLVLKNNPPKTTPNR